MSAGEWREGSLDVTKTAKGAAWYCRQCDREGLIRGTDEVALREKITKLSKRHGPKVCR